MSPKSKPPGVYCLEFSGKLLERGFWLYVWRIHYRRHDVFYVGRTGDSSSRFASSPISRMGQHLSISAKASANMLIRHLRTERLNIDRCTYEMIAMGPFFPEQRNLKAHRFYRDRMAALESGLALHLKERGLKVVGQHPRRGETDHRTLTTVITAFDRMLVRSIKSPG